MFTSPFAIVIYIIVAVVFIMTIIAHMHKEKYVASILQASPTRRARIIKSYKNLRQIHKILISSLLFLIILMIIVYLWESRADFMLLMIGFTIMVLIKVIEAMLFRKSIISRVETEQSTTLQQVTVTDEAQTDTTDKLHKVNIRLSIIGISITVVTLSAFSIALYSTIGGPVWAYVAITIVTLLAVCVTLKTTIK